MHLRTYFILLFSIACIRSNAQVEEELADSIIYWKEEVKLTWRDFQGIKAPILLSFDNIGALTCSSIEVLPDYDANGRLIYIAVNTFRKKCSWVKDTLSPFSRALLEHEQLHFDIGELYARKIRCKIFEFSIIDKKDLM